MSRLDPPLTDESMQIYCRWFHQILQKSREECGMRSLRQVRAKIDFSKNGLSDEAIGRLLQALQRSELQVVSLNLFGNCLTQAGAQHIAEFIRGASLPLRELHLAHNRLDEESVLELASAFVEHPRCCRGESRPAPVWLRLNNNWVAEPRRVWRRVHTLCGQAGGVCLAHDQSRCDSSRCLHARGGVQPLLHLYMFEVQDQPSLPANRSSDIAASCVVADSVKAALPLNSGRAGITSARTGEDGPSCDDLAARAGAGQSYDLWRPGVGKYTDATSAPRSSTADRAAASGGDAKVVKRPTALVGTSVVASALRKPLSAADRRSSSVSFKEDMVSEGEGRDQSSCTAPCEPILQSPSSASSSSSEEAVTLRLASTSCTLPLPMAEASGNCELKRDRGVRPSLVTSDSSRKQQQQQRYRQQIQDDMSVAGKESLRPPPPPPRGNPELTPEPELHLKADVLATGAEQREGAFASENVNVQPYPVSSGHDKHVHVDPKDASIRKEQVAAFDVEAEERIEAQEVPAKWPAKLLAPPRILQRPQTT